MPTLILNTDKQEDFFARAVALTPGEMITIELRTKHLSLLFKSELERLSRKYHDYSLKVFREGRFVTAQKKFQISFETTSKVKN